MTNESGKNFRLDKDQPTNEIKIPLEAAHKVFIKVFQVSGTDDTRGWPERVVRAIKKELHDPVVTAKYLRDKYNLVRKGLKENTGEGDIGFLQLYLDVLTGYAGITQEELSNRQVSHEPAIKSWQVYYTDKPFGLFDLWRVPDDGILTITETRRFYKSADIELSLEDIVSGEICRMPGDQAAHWVKIVYRDKDQNVQREAYFAIIQHDTAGRLIMAGSGTLIRTLLAEDRSHKS